MAERKGAQEVPCRYFDAAGGGNTGAVLDAAAERAARLGIDTICIASVSGKTAIMAAKRYEDRFRLIAVTHVTGFSRPNVQEMKPSARKQLETIGVTVLTAQHAFGGVGRAVRNKFGTYQVDEIMAHTLRIFGQGAKVAVEIALMAADAGLVRTDSDIVCIGGTGEGVDTALVVRPANSARLFDLKVREVICKPREF